MAHACTASTASTTASTPSGDAASNLKAGCNLAGDFEKIMSCRKPYMDDAMLEQSPSKSLDEANASIEILKRRNRAMADDMQKLMRFVEEIVGIPSGIQQQVMNEVEGVDSWENETKNETSEN